MLIGTVQDGRRDGVLFEGDWLPLVGLAVAEAKAMLKDAWSIPYFADAYVNGCQVSVVHVLRSGDRLDFSQRFGVKAGDGKPIETVETVGRPQVRPMQGRLDVQPIVEEIAAAILARSRRCPALEQPATVAALTTSNRPGTPKRERQ